MIPSAIHVIPISGKDSLATALVCQKLHPDREHVYFFNDTNMELPETMDWLNKVQASMGIEIVRVGQDLEKIIREQGILPSPRVRYCTRLSKIYPMEDWLKRYKDREIFIYFGIRADENRVGYRPLNRNLDIKPLYPLVEAGLDLKAVYELLGRENLLPPTFFWPELHKRVEQKLSSHADLIEELPRWQFDSFFAWRSRANCFMCFFQRQYELVALYEFHPELAQRMVDLENSVGSEKFTLRDAPLMEIVAGREHILERRARDVAKNIRKRAQFSLFQAEEESTEQHGRSCGLFCGK